MIGKILIVAFTAAMIISAPAQIEFITTADAKENCTKGYKWNKKTQKCEEDPGSY